MQIFLIEGYGRLRACEQTVKQVQSMFQDLSQLSIREAASALDISTATVHRTLRKCLFVYPYIIQNFHDLQNNDKIKRLQLSRHRQNQSEGYPEYLSKLVSPMNTFFVSMVQLTSKM